MRKTVNICGYDIEVATNPASVFRYKNEFGRDGFQEVMRMASLVGIKKGKINDEAVTEVFTSGKIDFDFVYRWLWLFASTADPDVLPYDKYFEQFDVRPLQFVIEALPHVMDLVLKDTQTTVKNKKK